MNSLVKTGIAFVVGGAIGAVTAWKITSMKYDKLIDEEIASVKKYYGKERKSSIDEENPAKSKEAKEEYEVFVKDYSASSDEKEVKEETPSEPANDIYIITEDEFVEGRSFYDKVSITRYADGYFVDEDDSLVEGEVLVGKLFDNVSPDFDGVEYVRNERMGTDYEVIFSVELYSELLDEKAEESNE